MPTGVYERTKPVWNKGKTFVPLEEQKRLKNALKMRWRRAHGVRPKEEMVGENHQQWVDGRSANMTWYHLHRTYGITKESFYARLAAQDGLCMVCGDPLLAVESVDGRSMDATVVDHNHACCPGEQSCGRCVRGLLHGRCNRGLGFFKDNPAILRRAADYLENHHDDAKDKS